MNMSEATAAPSAAPAPAATPAAAPAAPLSAASALIEAPATTTTTEPVAAAPGDAPAEPAAETPAPLVMPGKDATPEQWAEFYAAIGRPETPEAYELPVPEGDDGTFAKQMAPVLHKHGVTAAQAKGLAEDWNAMVQAQTTAAAEAAAAEAVAMDTRNKAEAAQLENEWGQQHKENMHFAKLAAKQFLPAEKAGDVIAAIESKIGYKATIQFLHSIGKGLGEHDAAGMGQPSGQGRKSAAEILYGGSAPKQ
jgi:hypothetical protein